MGFFRKRPVVVEARYFAVGASEDDQQSLMAWCGGSAQEGFRRINFGPLGARRDANPGDWIVRGVNGAFYPVPNDEFVWHYDGADGGPEGVGDEVRHIADDLLLLSATYEEGAGADDNGSARKALKQAASAVHAGAMRDYIASREGLFRLARHGNEFAWMVEEPAICLATKAVTP